MYSFLESMRPIALRLKHFLLKTQDNSLKLTILKCTILSGFTRLNLNTKNTKFSLTRIQQHWRIPIYLSIGLIWCSAVNIELFHTLVELFAIGIAIMSFVVSWQTHSFSKNKFFLFLGCGYFWVGMLDLLHTLTFSNANILHDTTPSSSLHIWVVARYFEAITLLLASYISLKTIKPKTTFLVFSTLSCIAILVVFIPYLSERLLPEFFIPGEGLTASKIANEYVIIGILLLAAIRFSHLELKLEDGTKTLLIASVVLTILAEIHFTLYQDMGALPLVIGHIFKLFSFWAIYRALIESSLTRPFRSLTQVVSSYDNITDPTVIIDQDGIIQQANKIVRDSHKSSVVGKTCHEVLHPAHMSIFDCPICKAIEAKQSIKAMEYFDSDQNIWFEATISGLLYSEDYSASVHSLRDISLRKKVENKYASLNRVYSVMSHTNQAIIKLQDRNLLFQEICDIAVTYGELKMAWVGIIDGNIVKPEFVAGTEQGYFNTMQMRIDDSEWAKGPVGIAANSKQIAYVNDVHSNPDFWPWRKAAIERGYQALAAVPLFFKDDVVAIFTLYSEEINVFDDELVSLLSQLSNDISSSLFHMHQTKQKLLAEATVRKLSRAVKQSGDAIIITDTDGVVEYVNPEFTQLTGYAEAEIIGRDTTILKSSRNDVNLYKDMWDTITNGEIWRGELLNKKKNGDIYWSNQSVAPIKNKEGEVTHYVSTSTDNTKLHEAQETIQQLALYDPLTKLANRRLFLDRLDHAVISAERHREKVAVFMCDLDNFKNVNDSLGHEYGDELLQHIATILEQDRDAEDTVSRLGGDEFTMVISSFKNESSLADIASQILSKLEKPVLLKGNQIVVSSSIGIALYPQDGTDSQALMRAADLAMYHAKEEGKNRFQFYQREMNERAQGRLNLENALRDAIENKAFELHYQPQVEIESGNIIGFEALIRWRNKDNELVPPFQFIPIAEESGLIEPIGDWVIQQAMHDWQKLKSWGFSDSQMAVNVSAFQFKHSSHLHNTIKEMLDTFPDSPPEKLTIELTESTLIDNVEDTIEALHKLKGLGVSLSIDDFGTGYSSLNYLKRFPVDQLKIDKSFVDDMLQGDRDEAVVTAIISIAQKLRMKVIAEGVESKEQASYLHRLACSHAQGYLFYKPMKMEEIRQLPNLA